jgi:regulator of sigma E protease
MTIVLGIIGISVLVFVHELGHFLAAKWAGAGVKTFALGFDPTIRGVRLKLVSWRWGETEYVIGLIPFGGYVRPEDSEGAGEDDEGSPYGEFASQPPFKRAVIFAAGAGMNLLFGFAAFALAFGIGVSFESPEVGSVRPGSPAWYAGIRPGDALRRVNGKRVESFMDVAVSAALGGTSEQLLTIERGGTLKEVAVTPRIDPVMGIPAIGITPTVSRTVAEVVPGSGAATAGIRPGGEVTAAVFRPGAAEVVLDEHLPSGVFVGNLARLAENFPREEFRLRLKSPAGAVTTETLTSQPDPDVTVPRLGVMLAQYTVNYVRPDSEASRLFAPGDMVASLNGEPLLVVDKVRLAERLQGRKEFSLRLASGQEIPLARAAFLAWLVRGDLVFGNTRTAVRSVAAGSRAERAGLKPGDRVTGVGDTPVGHEDTFEELVGTEPVRLTFYREGERRETVLPAGEGVGVTWDHRPVVGLVQPDSAAAEAGIAPGDMIVRIDDRKLDSWTDLVETVLDRGDRSMDVTVVPADAGTSERQYTATPRVEPLGSLGVRFEQARITVREGNVVQAVGLGVKRTGLWIKRIFLTIHRLVRGEVAARNLQGPVGIIHITGMVTRYGLGTLLYFLALISVNLGVLNLLPLPIFDGGHLLLLACEKIKGSPVNEKVVQGATTVMFFLLIALAVYVTYHDVLRLFL